MIPVLLVGLRLGRIALWIPMFLLWPLILALFVLAFPFLLVYSVIKVGLAAFRLWFLGVPRAYLLLCSLRGFRVSVESPGTRMGITLV